MTQDTIIRIAHDHRVWKMCDVKKTSRAVRITVKPDPSEPGTQCTDIKIVSISHKVLASLRSTESKQIIHHHGAHGKLRATTFILRRIDDTNNYNVIELHTA